MSSQTSSQLRISYDLQDKNEVFLDQLDKKSLHIFFADVMVAKSTFSIKNRRAEDLFWNNVLVFSFLM